MPGFAAHSTVELLYSARHWHLLSCRPLCCFFIDCNVQFTVHVFLSSKMRHHNLALLTSLCLAVLHAEIAPLQKQPQFRHRIRHQGANSSTLTSTSSKLYSQSNDKLIPSPWSATVQLSTDVEEQIHANSLIMSLPMFQSQDKSSIFPISLKRPKYVATDDNFDRLYQKMNSSVEQSDAHYDPEVEVEIRKAPTGRSLADDDIDGDWRAEDITLADKFDDSTPFAVTPGLEETLSSAPSFPFTMPPPVAAPVAPDVLLNLSPAATTTKIEVPSSPVTNPPSNSDETAFFDVEDTATSTPSQTSDVLITPLPYEFEGSAVVENGGDLVSNDAIMNSEPQHSVELDESGRRYIVSGTHVYTDNRIQGTVRRTPSRLYGNKNFPHPEPLPAKENLEELERNEISTATDGTATVLRRKSGNTVIEQRIILRNRQPISVNLMNPALHGADLLLGPAAVFQIDLRRRRPHRRRVRLHGAKTWRANDKNVDDNAIEVPLSMAHFIGIQKEVPSTTTRRPPPIARASPIFRPLPEDGPQDISSDAPLMIVEHDNPTTKAHGLPTLSVTVPSPESTLLSATSGKTFGVGSQAMCELGFDPVLVASRGFFNTFAANLDTVVNRSDDDCAFSCLANLAGYMDTFACQTAQFDAETQVCSLSSDALVNTLTAKNSSVFYEKVCVSRDVGKKCSGATIERQPQKILSGFVKHVWSAESPAKCIESCVRAEKEHEFRCLSALFYFEEPELNCVLNEASAISHPEKMQPENQATVDYYGMDQCYGIREILNDYSSSNDVDAIEQKLRMWRKSRKFWRRRLRDDTGFRKKKRNLRNKMRETTA